MSIHSAKTKATCWNLEAGRENWTKNETPKTFVNLQPETGWDINSGKTVLVFDVVLVVVVACAVVDAVVVDAVVADSVAVDAVAVDAVVVDAVLVDAVAVDAVAVDAVAVDAVVVDAVAVDASYIKIIMAELRRGAVLRRHHSVSCSHGQGAATCFSRES